MKKKSLSYSETSTSFPDGKAVGGGVDLTSDHVGLSCLPKPSNSNFSIPSPLPIGMKNGESENEEKGVLHAMHKKGSENKILKLSLSKRFRLEDLEDTFVRLNDTIRRQNSQQSERYLNTFSSSTSSSNFKFGDNSDNTVSSPYTNPSGSKVNDYDTGDHNYYTKPSSTTVNDVHRYLGYRNRKSNSNREHLNKQKISERPHTEGDRENSDLLLSSTQAYSFAKSYSSVFNEEDKRNIQIAYRSLLRRHANNSIVRKLHEEIVRSPLQLSNTPILIVILNGTVPLMFRSYFDYILRFIYKNKPKTSFVIDTRSASAPQIENDGKRVHMFEKDHQNEDRIAIGDVHNNTENKLINREKQLKSHQELNGTLSVHNAEVNSRVEEGLAQQGEKDIVDTPDVKTSTENANNGPYGNKKVTDKDILTHLEYGLWQRNLDDEISFYAWKYVAFSILPIFPSVLQSIMDVMSVTYTMVNDSCFAFNMKSLANLYNSQSSGSSSAASVIDTLADRETSFYYDSLTSNQASSKSFSLGAELKNYISSNGDDSDLSFKQCPLSLYDIKNSFTQFYNGNSDYNQNLYREMFTSVDSDQLIFTNPSEINTEESSTNICNSLFLQINGKFSYVRMLIVFVYLVFATWSLWALHLKLKQLRMMKIASHLKAVYMNISTTESSLIRKESFLAKKKQTKEKENDESTSRRKLSTSPTLQKLKISMQVRFCQLRILLEKHFDTVFMASLTILLAYLFSLLLKDPKPLSCVIIGNNILQPLNRIMSDNDNKVQIRKISNFLQKAIGPIYEQCHSICPNQSQTFIVDYDTSPLTWLQILIFLGIFAITGYTLLDLLGENYFFVDPEKFMSPTWQPPYKNIHEHRNLILTKEMVEDYEFTCKLHFIDEVQVASKNLNFTMREELSWGDESQNGENTGKNFTHEESSMRKSTKSIEKINDHADCA